MKKSTKQDTRLVPLATIISYSTILYHKNVNSQYVTNVGCSKLDVGIIIKT